MTDPTLTPATRQAISQMVFTVREAHDQFLKCYQMALTDVAPDWRATWKTWPAAELASTLRRLHTAMRAECLACGMTAAVWKTYQRAAVNATFLNIPFSFAGRLTSKEIGKVREVAATIPTGSHEDKVRQACQVVQKAKNERTARSIMRGRTILAEPTEVEDLTGTLAGQLFKYLTRDDVRDSVDGVALLRKVAASLKRNRKVTTPVTAGSRT